VGQLPEGVFSVASVLGQRGEMSSSASASASVNVRPLKRALVPFAGFGELAPRP
jgi:hypothetical protein